jgi:hypothetical protein
VGVTGSNAGKLLDLLSSTNAAVSIGLVVGETVVPLIVGLVKEIKSQIAGEGDKVEYTVVVQAEHAVLDKIIADGTADLAAINAELERLGLPPLAVPPAAP